MFFFFSFFFFSMENVFTIFDVLKGQELLSSYSL